MPSIGLMKMGRLLLLYPKQLVIESLITNCRF